MILCLCKAVTDREVNEAIEDGARSVAAVGRLTGAGTDCGCCQGAIQSRITAFVRAEAKRCENRCADCPSLQTVPA